MNGDLDKKVCAAATAGWWTVLIGVVWLTVGWLVLLAFLGAKPGWLLKLWGGGELTWETVHTVMLYFMGAFKLILFVAVLCTIWLTILAKKLKAAGGS